MHVVLIICFLLAVSFIAIFLCKTIALEKSSKYPQVECEDVKKLFGEEKFVQYAYREHVAYYSPKNEEDPTPLSGPLQCHCKDMSKTLGGGLKLMNYEVLDDNGENKRNICEEYVVDGYVTLFYNQSVGYMIVAINYILRLFIIKLIIYIGKDTESEQTRLITNGIFIVQFFNTGLLLLSVNANLAEQSPVLGFMFGRKMPDFDTLWFQAIGNTLVGAMMFNLYWPLIEFCVFWGMRTAYRMLDRSFSCKKTTKKTTLQLYYELYAGPTFFIHYKYSAILNITFVTFLYGVGLPILFPIAAASLFVLYIVEKTMLHYSYRQPPMYDERLNNNVLGIMTYAPLLFLAFGYWMLSSKQLLDNKVSPIRNDSDIPRTGHLWKEVFTAKAYQLNPAMPLLVTFWLFLIGICLRNVLYDLVTRWVPSLKVGDLEIDEDLDNYFNTLDDHDRNWSIKEEEYARSMLKIKVLHDKTLQKLKATTMGEGHMKGVHTYDILANPLYLDDFQYFSSSMDNRADYIIDDDDDEDNDAA